ncbi:MAG TPA: UPF0104 family protein [Allocoleopsis sp.]
MKGKQRLTPHLGSLLGFLLLGLSIWAIAHELRAYHYRDVWISLTALSLSRLYWAIGLTALGYLVMTGYDLLAFRYIHQSLTYPKIAFTNFISSAVGNTIGLALLTGSAIRYRFYSVWGVSAIAIAQIVAFATLTFWLGLFAVSGIIFLVNPLTIPLQLNLPFFSVRPLGVIFLFVVAAYLVGSCLGQRSIRLRGQDFRFPTFSLALAQVAVSAFDWILAAAALYVLLPSTSSLSYTSFLGIYLLAMTAGVVSNVPGGLGVFETVILLILAPQIPATTVLGSLLAYRGIYYILPLGGATILLGVYEIAARLKTHSS